MGRPNRPSSPVTGGDEDGVVRRIADIMGRASGSAPAGTVWIGDDAAVVPPPAGRLVLSTDAVVAGVHADLRLVGLDDLGWKALTAAVSDIGAVGARPCHALVTFCLPPGTDVDLLAGGIADAAAHWHCPVVGGDVTGADQLMVSVAVTGVLEGSRPPVLRGGASAGDWLLVTGPLGSSAAGLRLLRELGHGEPARQAGAAGDDQEAAIAALVAAHRRPLARLVEGRMARSAGATAMMDLSDGLGIDLHRMAEASGVGVRVEEVPVAPGATFHEALAGGEDYELLLATVDPEGLTAAFAAAGLRPPAVIGRCTASPRERVLAGGPLPREGWTHAVG